MECQDDPANDNYDRWWKEQERLKRRNAIWTGIHMLGWPVGFLLLFVLMMNPAQMSRQPVETITFVATVMVITFAAGATVGGGAYVMFSRSTYLPRRMAIVMGLTVIVALFSWALVLVLT